MTHPASFDRVFFFALEMGAHVVPRFNLRTISLRLTKGSPAIDRICRFVQDSSR